MKTALLAKLGPTTTALLAKPGLTTTAPPRDQAKEELGIAISAISAIILTAFIFPSPNELRLWPDLLCLEFTTFLGRRQESDLKVAQSRSASQVNSKSAQTPT
jgi:hypothetical protein